MLIVLVTYSEVRQNLEDGVYWCLRVMLTLQKPATHLFGSCSLTSCLSLSIHASRLVASYIEITARVSISQSHNASVCLVGRLICYNHFSLPVQSRKPGSKSQMDAACSVHLLIKLTNGLGMHCCEIVPLRDNQDLLAWCLRDLERERVC